MDPVWSAVVAGLEGDPATGLNTARECCERFAGDRGRLALTVRHPDGTRERWTYFELARAAARAARLFARAGLRPGDRVAAVLSRQVEAWICALAAWRSGLTYVPLYCGFGTQALTQRLRPTEPAAVVVGWEWRENLDGTLRELSAEPRVFTVAGPAGRGIRRGDHSFWAEMESCAPDGPAASTAAGDVATIMFTSGTTTEPKGCLIPHAGFVSLVPFVRHCFALGADDVLFTTSDPGWSYGLYTTGFVPMALGTPRVVYSGDFDTQAWLQTIEAEQITFVAGAPSAFRRLLAAARTHGVPSSLRAATCAGEPLDADTCAAWQDVTGTPLRDGYGLSEVGMALANLGDPPTQIVPGSLGAAVPGFEVGLVSRSGEPVPAGEEGIIAVRRPPFQLCSGYLHAPDEWARRWVGDWFLTEDVARRDEAGRWWFRGRADDVIVTSGYNVGPVEVETVLLEQPGVAEAAVVAQPDPARGSVVRAVIVPTSKAPAAEAMVPQLQEAVRQRIGRHAYPRVVDFVEGLPRTETGKLRRAELRRNPSRASGPAAP
jgi:acetyl-CoA synthetase